MATILLESKSASNIKLLLELAKKLGVKVSVLDASDIEEIKLGKLMENERTDEFIDRSEIMEILNTHSTK